jgi:biopolymer transport protein ExbD
VAQVSGDSGGRNPVADVNLIPFIDLMSVCIIFLLLTAVWTQVSMIQIGSSVYGKKNDVTQAEPPPRPEVAFRMDVVDSGYILNVGKSRTDIPRKNGLFDRDGLYKALVTIKQQYPDKNDAIIAMADELTYEELIRGMDTLLLAGFPEISVATGGAK